jgi:quercetin 2,3-dioxygenase
MIQIRRSEERGHEDHGWLDTRHTFSFAEYVDPKFMGFRSLRVINEDRVQPGKGFPTHRHAEMEIISYVLEGAIAHKDSTGTGATLRPGEVQRMTAGTGIAHSEFNPSAEEPLHFLQIWILPEKHGLPPGYEQKRFKDEERRNRFRLVASRDGREGSLVIHQDVSIYATTVTANEHIRHSLEKGRSAWIQVARGEVDFNGFALNEGDGASATGETALDLRALRDSELLVFDLA